MLELSGRPLLDNLADSRLYVRRDEHNPIGADARHRLNAIVAGDRGSGKTSLLRQLTRELRDSGEPVVFIDGKTATEPTSFLEVIRRQLIGAPNLAISVRNENAVAVPDPGADESGRLLGQLDHLRRMVEPAVRIVLLVDGLPSPTVGHELFGRMRDELWQLPFSWVIAVDSRERAALMEPPADAFFDRLVSLRPLTEAQSVQLLEKRVEGDTRAPLLPLAEAAEGNPRTLIALARDAFEGGQAVEDLLASRAWREAAASQLSRPASMLLAEVENMGGASASDEELLKRLGWTRPRAAQVFSELEAVGLVTSREVKGPGGRPRKVFQIDRSFRGRE